MAYRLSVPSDISLDDVEPDLRTSTGKARMARSIHQCLAYLSHEVELVGDNTLSEALERAILAAENTMRRYPDYRN